MQQATATAENLLDQAEDALDHGDAQACLAICSKVLEAVPEHPGATFLWAEAMRDLGDLDQAEGGYRRAVALTPTHSASWSALASVLFDMLRFEEARTCVLRAVRIDPMNPEAYYIRAMLRERRADAAGAQRDYIRADRLDPAQFPRPIPLSEAMVEAIVIDALSELHPSVRAYLSQVAIILEEVPEAETCLQYMPPAPPSEILGYFAGVSMRDRSIENPWSTLPSAIILFRRNLERIAIDRDNLIEELRVTVFHEVGHFLGLTEDDLAARGLE